MPVKILLAAMLTLLGFDVSASAAQAMPFRSAQTRLIISVSSGCSSGVHRNGCIVIYRGDNRGEVPERQNSIIQRGTTLDKPATAADKAAADKAAAEKPAAKAAAGIAARETLAAKEG